MALNFSSGLLTGLQTFGQGGGAIPADPRQRDLMQAAGVTNPLLQQFGKSVGGLFGVETRSPAAIAGSELSTALSGSPEDQKKAAQRLASLGYSEQAIQLLESANAAEQEIALKQQQEAAVKSNIDRATAFNLPQETIDSYAAGGIDEKTFNSLIKDARDKTAAANINKATDERQIRAQITYAERFEAPPSIVAQIKNGDFVGNTELLQDTLKGKADNKSVNNSTWLNQETGQYITYPTSNGKILVLGEDGSETWKYPQQVNPSLVEAPVRQVGGREAFSGKLTQGQATTTGAAVNVTNNMIELLDGKTRGEQAAVLGLASVGIPTDESSIVSQYNILIPDVRGRIVSGAALKKDEEERYNKLFGISFKDAISPVAIARKLRISYILNEVDSKLGTGEMTPTTARQALDQALAFDFSPQEKEQLEAARGSNFKAVLSKYQPNGSGVASDVQDAINFFK
jgi:glutaredoxin-related protein